jgi:hypothetical protein
MIKKIIAYIICGITGFLLVTSVRLIPSLQNFTDDTSYTSVDIYNLPATSYEDFRNISVTVDGVAVDAGEIPAFDGHYYVVLAGTSSSDTIMMLQMMVSDEQTIRGLSALASNPDSAHVTVKGYLGEVPDRNREELIAGFMAGGLTRSEAETFYRENMVDAMFVESAMLGGLGNIAAFIIMGATVVMLIISILLTLSVKKDADRERYSAGFTPPGGGYMHPDGTITKREMKGVYAPPGAGGSSIGYNSPNGYKPQGSGSGGYVPPGGYVPQGGYAPPKTGSGGYVPPGGTRGGYSPSANHLNEPLTDENGNPFDPTKIKQPDYDDFFNDKKPKASTSSAPAAPKKPTEDISDFYDIEMEAVSVPDLPSAAAHTDGDLFDDFITPPDVSILEDKSLDSYKPADTDFSFPKTDVPAIESDPISDMDLNEYLSADFLSADFTPDDPND